MVFPRNEPYWKPIERAPVGVPLRVRVGEGADDYALPFPVLLTSGGWVNARSGKALALRPTQWHPFVETLPSRRTWPRGGSPSD
jgi:hypothetical protein